MHAERTHSRDRRPTGMIRSGLILATVILLTGAQAARADTDEAPAAARSAMQAQARHHATRDGEQPTREGDADMPMHQGHPAATSSAVAPPVGSLPVSDGSAPKDGRTYGVTLEMPGDPRLFAVMLDKLEWAHGRDANAQAWELRSWAGYDLDRLWLRSEGVRSGGRVEEGDAELLWGHAVSAYWDLMLGVRHDLSPGPSRDWLAIGIQGLAPYQFEFEASAYAGTGGRTAVRLRASQEWLFTQRLILEPELEAEAYGRADPAHDIGAGVSQSSLGLRLRYEFGRKFAPYLGYARVRKFGATASLARQQGEPVLDRQWLLGVRAWF